MKWKRGSWSVMSYISGLCVEIMKSGLEFL